MELKVGGTGLLPFPAAKQGERGAYPGSGAGHRGLACNFLKEGTGQFWVVSPSPLA